jgi:membrane associated rhomboid family serine protease
VIPIRDHNPTSGVVWVVWVLLLTNAVAFLLPWWEAQGEGIEAYWYRFGFTPSLFVADPLAEGLTLLSYAFFHGGWAHLIGNMVFLFVFGDNVEDRLGHLRFAAFYLVGAAVAAVAHALATVEPNIPMIGASGSISAVLGAYLRFYPGKRVQAVVVPLIVPWLILRIFSRVSASFFLWTLPAWFYLGYWAIIQVIEGTLSLTTLGSGVAWWAHIGGFLFGLLAAPWFARPPSRYRAGSRRP